MVPLHIPYKPVPDRPKLVDYSISQAVSRTKRQVMIRCPQCYAEGISYKAIPKAVVNKNYHRKQPNYICPHGMQLTDEHGYIICKEQETIVYKEVYIRKRQLNIVDVRAYFHSLHAAATRNQACERCGRVIDSTRPDKQGALVSIDIQSGNAAIFLCCLDCAQHLQSNQTESVPDLMDWLRFHLPQTYAGQP